MHLTCVLNCFLEFWVKCVFSIFGRSNGDMSYTLHANNVRFKLDSIPSIHVNIRIIKGVKPGIKLNVSFPYSADPTETWTIYTLHATNVRFKLDSTPSIHVNVRIIKGVKTCLK